MVAKTHPSCSCLPHNGCFASGPAIAHWSMILISFVFAIVGSSNEFQDVGSYNTCWIYTQTAGPETRLQGYGQDCVCCYFYDVAKSSTLFSVGEGCLPWPKSNSLVVFHGRDSSRCIHNQSKEQPPLMIIEKVVGQLTVYATLSYPLWVHIFKATNGKIFQCSWEWEPPIVN